MSKKSNTLWFMLAATVLNILLMMILFIVCFILITRFVDPNSSLIPMWLGLTFVVSIGGSFFVYSKIIKWMNKKFNLEQNLSPLWGGRRPNKRKQE
ncbi:MULTISPECIES: leader peptide processing enzyme [Sphaerochaeta]|jgi:drug/metabolite transporter (DMT)-like permease|uniref:Leader peptide processing enzyme n=2 Tax=root TaxID=1 RepID=A0ABY4D9N4_9SPIR|nr:MULTISPECIES: leader peptide processing enzyme [Sphaerochaeta]MDT3359680.1 leader peptide processing enzyme [Spirochaetota bacterium]NLA98038.1 leader peptide processing enzyme [Spirochaetales bacterium]MDD3424219.1 leader peptide processing enzyme [Sphaerochaeta sp.]MDD3456884.1 leader peptide processing enzyme [Sphaerochaeta sp.]MDD4037594.1 leader peptide processing enzyme [Sphaerochaeta sp.]